MLNRIFSSSRRAAPFLSCSASLFMHISLFFQICVCRWSPGPPAPPAPAAAAAALSAAAAAAASFCLASSAGGGNAVQQCGGYIQGGLQSRRLLSAGIDSQAAPSSPGCRRDRQRLFQRAVARRRSARCPRAFLESGNHLAGVVPLHQRVLECLPACSRRSIWRQP